MQPPLPISDGELDLRVAQAVRRMNLGSKGIGCGCEALPPDFASQVRASVGYLSRTRLPKRGRGSYRAKHEIERAVGRYISNGAAIAGAYVLGYIIVPIGINAILREQEE